MSSQKHAEKPTYMQKLEIEQDANISPGILTFLRINTNFSWARSSLFASVEILNRFCQKSFNFRNHERIFKIQFGSCWSTYNTFLEKEKSYKV